MSLTQINKAGLDEIALDHVFTIGASGSSAYTFQGEGLNGTVNNPTLYLTRGKTYRFENGSGGHPIRIQSTSGASGTAYNTGVTNNAGSGTVIVEVQHDAPDVLYYQCTSHAAMNGILYITGALADGGVTEAKLATSAVTEAKIANGAVTTVKIADSNISTAKIAAGAVTEAKLATNAVTTDKINSGVITNAKLAANAVGTANIKNNAVTTDKIADDSIRTRHYGDNSIDTAFIADQAITLAKLEHGTSSNDGKFLRANNGADPTFESLPSSGVTVSNNANNRVVTGDGTNLNAEANLTFDGSTLGVTGGLNVSSDVKLNTNTNVDLAAVQTGGTKNYSAGIPRDQLGVADAQSYDTTDNGGAIAFHAKYHANGAYTTMGSIEGVKTNNSSGNYEGALVFKTRVHGGNNIIGMRLTNSGLCFGTDTAAVNALDDYEEGTWTLDFANGANYSLQSGTNTGHYVKIGRLCFIRGYIRISSVTGGQTWSADISGLPFTSGISGYDQPISVMGLSWSYNSGQSGLVGQVKGGSTQIRLRNNRYDGHGYTVTAYNMTNSTRVWVAGCYYV